MYFKSYSLTWHWTDPTTHQQSIDRDHGIAFEPDISNWMNCER